MFLLAIIDRPRAKLVRPQWQGSCAGIAFALFTISLFLPWQRACYPKGREFALIGVSGRCISSNGWTLETSVAAFAAAGLVAVAFAPPLRRFARGELAAGVALLVATIGLRLETGIFGGFRFSFGYGSIVGFVAAAMLFGLALTRPRVPAGWSRAAVAVPAIAFGAAYVAVVVLPWWDVLPTDVWSVFAIGPTRLSWLTIAAAAIGLRMTRLWLSRLGDSSSSADELVLLPLALVALAAIDAVRFGIAHPTWNSVLLGCLALGLTVLGLVERSGGLSAIEIPEILRIDRI
jgi:hypothetical protein